MMESFACKICSYRDCITTDKLIWNAHKPAAHKDPPFTCDEDLQITCDETDHHFCADQLRRKQASPAPGWSVGGMWRVGQGQY